MKKLSFLTLLITAALACASCAKDYTLVGTEREQGGDPIWLSTSVTVQNTRAAGAVAKNIPVLASETDMDNKVYSLRMIISDSQTGKVVYNERTDNPQEVEAKYNQTSGEAAAWKKPIKILPGTYDFWFIANEGMYWFSPTEEDWHKRDDYGWNGAKAFDQLSVGTNIARIFDGRNFEGERQNWEPLSHLDFSPYRKYSTRERRWVPKVNTDVDAWNSNWSNRPMPMSAVYRNIKIYSTRNHKGTSERDPQHFIAGGDEVVKLVRCMAKVTLILEKAAYVNGNKTVRNLQWPWMGKFALTVLNRPRYWSYFNTPLFEMNHTPREFKFYSDIFPDDQSRYRCMTVSEGNNISGDLGEYGSQNSSKNKVSGNESELDNFSYTFYVPELLLPKDRNDGNPSKGGQAVDRLNALMLAFSPIDKGFWGKTSNDMFQVHPGAADNKNFYPYASKKEFVAKLDETKAFNIGTPDLTESSLPERTDNPKLPHPERYSNFSLLRNRHYEITIREKDRLQVDVRIAPWEADEHEGERLVYYGFNVMVSDPSFSNAQQQTEVQIQMTNLNPGVKRVKLTLLDQDGKTNKQAYFSNVGGMEAESGNRPKWVGFGNTADMKKDGGYAKCVINWNGATDKNAPMVGKAFVLIEYFSDDAMHFPIKGPSDNPETIVVRRANWSSSFDNL